MVVWHPSSVAHGRQARKGAAVSRGGCYIWRTRKPGAVFGLPIIGRHTAYVGETVSFYHRERQHLLGGGTYDVRGKDWADLAPRCYRIPLPTWKWLMRSVETLLIWVLCPVYNIRKQPFYNIRKIKPSTARLHRLAREVGRKAAPGWRRIGVTVARCVLAVRPIHSLPVAILVVALWRM